MPAAAGEGLSAWFSMTRPAAGSVRSMPTAPSTGWGPWPPRSSPSPSTRPGTGPHGNLFTDALSGELAALDGGPWTGTPPPGFCPVPAVGRRHQHDQRAGVSPPPPAAGEPAVHHPHHRHGPVGRRRRRAPLDGVGGPTAGGGMLLGAAGELVLPEASSCWAPASTTRDPGLRSPKPQNPTGPAGPATPTHYAANNPVAFTGPTGLHPHRHRVRPMEGPAQDRPRGRRGTSAATTENTSQPGLVVAVALMCTGVGRPAGRAHEPVQGPHLGRVSILTATNGSWTGPASAPEAAIGTIPSPAAEPQRHPSINRPRKAAEKQPDREASAETTGREVAEPPDAKQRNKPPHHRRTST